MSTPVPDARTQPSLDELRARLVGMINTPATRIAGVALGTVAVVLLTR